MYGSTVLFFVRGEDRVNVDIPTDLGQFVQQLIADGIVAHEGNGPSNGKPRPLGILAAARNVFALDRVLAEILNVDPEQVATIQVAQQMGLCPERASLSFPRMTPDELKVSDWRLPERLKP